MGLAAKSPAHDRPVLNLIEHGTRAAYLRGCRCDLCCSAGRAYQRAYDRARRTEMPRDRGHASAELLSRKRPRLTHGKRSTYDRGCPCEACREANRAYHALAVSAANHQTAQSS